MVGGYTRLVYGVVRAAERREEANGDKGSKVVTATMDNRWVLGTEYEARRMDDVVVLGEEGKMK